MYVNIILKKIRIYELNEHDGVFQDVEGDTLKDVIDRCKCMKTCPNVGNIWEKDECTLCNCEVSTLSSVYTYIW